MFNCASPVIRTVHSTVPSDQNPRQVLGFLSCVIFELIKNTKDTFSRKKKRRRKSFPAKYIKLL